ncbi:MAG: 1-acyl-sn-glycerol-3-phosphate acyltransferase [Myxococcota bacterium]|nr:1-acyl-sn-glycerol-3-phosphate acyltransferase [Myxococcota bacterium]
MGNDDWKGGETRDSDGLDPRGGAVQRVFVGLGKAFARWTRLEVEGPDRLPDPPALLVANHGFGGIFDLNGFAIATIIERLRPPNAQFTVLVHQLAWTLGIGPYLETAGCRPAGPAAAREALEAGHYLLVMPGGDLDGFKSFWHRNEVLFGNRTGFARTALEAGVPIQPIVVSGAGETLFVLSDGQRLARWIGLDTLARQKTIPISIALPYGFNVGLAGMLPYIPLPAKMRAAILDPIHARDGETAEALAARVHRVMSDKLTELTAGRIPFLGTAWPQPWRRE